MTTTHRYFYTQYEASLSPFYTTSGIKEDLGCTVEGTEAQTDERGRR